MSNTLSEQLEEYRIGWMQRVPADRRAWLLERTPFREDAGAERGAAATAQLGEI